MTTRARIGLLHMLIPSWIIILFFSRTSKHLGLGAFDSRVFGILRDISLFSCLHLVILYILSLWSKTKIFVKWWINWAIGAIIKEFEQNELVKRKEEKITKTECCSNFSWWYSDLTLTIIIVEWHAPTITCAANYLWQRSHIHAINFDDHLRWQTLATTSSGQFRQSSLYNN